MEAKEILGLDLGLKHTGVARASSVARIAEPLTSVSTAQALSWLKSYLTEHKVEAVALGLPRNMAGEDTAQTEWVRSWATNAKSQLAAPLYWQDEGLTSIEARIKNYELRSKHDEHAVAAAIILQDFLDSPETDRALC